jgi:hypothetical protein
MDWDCGLFEPGRLRESSFSIFLRRDWSLPDRPVGFGFGSAGGMVCRETDEW